METPVSMEQHGQIAVITIDNPPVNALSQAVRQGVLDSIATTNADTKTQGIIAHCAGMTFVAGADIKEFGKPPMEPHLPDVLAAVEQSAKPVLALLHGNALGGGLELALACHYRLAQASAKFGLPEVNLGLIPGAGGTQRLPRLIGVNAALSIITSGKPVTATAALDDGLVDALCEGDHEDLLESALRFMRVQAIPRGPRRNSEASVPVVDDLQAVFDKWRSTVSKRMGGQEAPLAAIESVANSIKLPFDQGMQAERELFLQRKQSPQSRAMRHAFFAERACAKVPRLGKLVKPQAVQHVGVIGVGTMGSGIAMCFASAGMDVVLLELNADNLQRGLAKIRGRYQQSVDKGQLSEQGMVDCLARIRGSETYVELADVDLVIEAAFESMQVKQEIFQQLESVCKPEAILASNTSYLDINIIAAATKRPEKVLGMHFFSPARVMKLLEVVCATQTSKQSLATAMDVGKKIGKISVAVGVCYGFVGNRMYSCYGREANALLLEGATPSQIDNAMQAWGMAMGPLAVTDMSGIDIGYKARREHSDPPADPLFFRAADLMVENKRLGQKTSAGFYDYVGGTRQSDSAAVELIRAEAAKLSVPPRAVSEEEIQQRLILALINEGAKTLQEGIANQASDIDVIWLNGYGFPRWRGGPMHYADEVGLVKVVDQIRLVQQQLPESSQAAWEPAVLLQRLASDSGEMANYSRTVEI